MHLRELCQAPHLRVYFDSVNEWLYLEWEGELTLPVVQRACLEVAQCFLGHLYPRVLNANSLVTHVDRDVAPWLAQNLLPALALAGVECLAWVHAPTVSGLDMVATAVQQTPGLHVDIFADEEAAVSWLQQTCPPAPNSGCALGRLPADEQKLTHLVGKLGQLVQAPA